MNRSAAAGLVIMIASEAGTLAHIEPFWSWNTPIAWTGFILFADAVVWQRRGSSWIRSNAAEFMVLSALSIPLWLIFELYNRFIHNWYYVGLPENTALRYFGYAWSFSTIWPAIFEGADLVDAFRNSQFTRQNLPGGNLQRENSQGAPQRAASPAAVVLICVLGVAMLVSPFVVSDQVAAYLAAPVWLGFILLLDPINGWLGETSLFAEMCSGDVERVVNLLASGALCGFLWEFWNYWARAKWHYTVPIMANMKLFEMPLPGYLGFPPFALECFTMYVFVRAVLRLQGRPIARSTARRHR